MSRAKQTQEVPVSKEKYPIGGKCVCPECQKEFVRTDEHKYLAGTGEPMCSWKCFLARVDRNVRESALNSMENSKKKKK